MSQKYPQSREVTSGRVKAGQCLWPLTSAWYDREIVYCRKLVVTPTSPTLCFAHHAQVYEVAS